MEERQVRDPVEPSAVAGSGRSGTGRSLWIIGVMGVLIVAAHAAGRWLQRRGYRMQVNAPPLTGNLDPRFTSRSLAAVAVGAAGIWRADDLAHRVAWRRVLWVGFATALAWSAALAFWDGTRGFTRSPLSAVDYLQALSMVADAPGAFLRGFLGGIDALPSHARVHPPGIVLFAWSLDRVGLGGAAWFAAIELLTAASAVPAALIAIADVAGRERARAAAPFLTLAPMAVFWSSGDAMFMGVGAWAVSALVVATGRRDRRGDGLALVGGLLAAVGLFLSYGLVLLGLVPLTVAVLRRRLRPVMLATLPVVLVAIAFGVAGFWWIDGLGVTRREYAESLARVRPYGYFVAANLVALAIALGPAVVVAIARLRDRRLWWLVGAALVAVTIADVSGLTKAEVERIWLPFMPWMIAATGAAFASPRSRRGWLAVQVGWALAIQAVVFSPW